MEKGIRTCRKRMPSKLRGCLLGLLGAALILGFCEFAQVTPAQAQEEDYICSICRWYRHSCINFWHSAILWREPGFPLVQYPNTSPKHHSHCNIMDIDWGGNLLRSAVDTSKLKYKKAEGILLK